MFLRFFLILSFMFSLGFSVELIQYDRFPLDQDHERMSYPDGNIDIRINYENVEEANAKDWIGIYKKGTSVAWKNVLAWSWVARLSGVAPMDYTGHIYRRQNLPPATYEARLFRNNSYTVEKSLEFTIKKSDSFLEELFSYYYDKEKNLRVVTRGLNKNFKPNPNDWMAIYKVGSSNAWNNVIKWTWTKDIAGKYGWYTWEIKNLNLPQGKYEVRYFLNNSYNVYKKSDYFSIVKDNSMARLDDMTLEYKYNQTFKINFYDTKANKKDWVGIFKKGAKKTRENILSWNYNRSGSKNGTIYINTVWGESTAYTDLKPGEYDVALFLNDSYKVLATSKIVITNDKQISIKVDKGFAAPTKISISINNYPDALKKDWVAIFKKGKAHIRANILSWSYTNAKPFVRLEGFRDGQEYTAVLFKNDTYNEIDNFDFKF